MRHIENLIGGGVLLIVFLMALTGPWGHWTAIGLVAAWGALGVALMAIGEGWGTNSPGDNWARAVIASIVSGFIVFGVAYWVVVG